MKKIWLNGKPFSSCFEIKQPLDQMKLKKK